MKRTSPVLAAVLSIVWSTSALANTVTSADANCNLTAPPATAVFSVTATTVVKCLFAGSDGNINGNTNDGGPGDIAMDNAGWDFDSNDQAWLTGTPVGLASGLTGTFAIAAAAYTKYDSIAIGFKSGQGQNDPYYAIFELAGNTLSGSWAINPGQNALSHALIWGKDNGGPPPTDLPEPGTALLAGLALLGLAASRKRRQD